MKQSPLITVLLLMVSAQVFAGGGERIVAPAILKSAIVYRNGAELTHTAKVSLAQGNNEVVIEGVSNNIEMNSVQLGSDGNLTIMSVTFTLDMLKPMEPSARTKKLQDSLEKINKDMDALNVLINTNQELIALLKANKEIRGTQNGLNVGELTKMVEYYKTKTLELQREIVQYKEKHNKLDETRLVLELQVAEEEKKNTKKIGKLIVQVYSPVSGQFNLNLSYITPLAAWHPAYDIKVDNISKPVKFSYKAKLYQTTGIDWNKVKLTLATSVPNQQNNAPELKTWFLAFLEPELSKQLEGSLSGRVSGLVVSERTGAVAAVSDEQLEIRGMKSLGGAGREPLYVVNGLVVSKAEFDKIESRAIENISILKDNQATSIYGSRAANGVIVATTKKNLGQYIDVKDNQLNVTFEIDLPYDVPTDGKEQNVALKDYTLPALYRYYAVPAMDKDAYLIGEIADWESLNLLPGNANIIFEGTFVGKTNIDPGSIRDTLNLTLGRDKRVVVKREKLQDFSSVKFLGANKKQVFTYEITVKNNKKENIELVLKEAYPVSSNKEIEVELLETSGANNESELGRLTWNVSLAAGESKKIRVSYSVKYPKDKELNLP